MPNARNTNFYGNKSGLNLSNLKRQENLASHFPESSIYEQYISQKIQNARTPENQNQVVSSNGFSAKELKQKFLQGQEDRYLFNADKAPDQAQNAPVEVHTLQLDHIPTNLSQDELKRKLGVNHLISLEVDTDNVKNVSTGKGKIAFRTNTQEDRAKLQQKLQDLGIQSGDYTYKNKKKIQIILKNVICITPKELLHIHKKKIINNSA